MNLEKIVREELAKFNTDSVGNKDNFVIEIIADSVNRFRESYFELWKEYPNKETVNNIHLDGVENTREMVRIIISYKLEKNDMPNWESFDSLVSKTMEDSNIDDEAIKQYLTSEMLAIYNKNQTPDKHVSAGTKIHPMSKQTIEFALKTLLLELKNEGLKNSWDRILRKNSISKPEKS